MKKQLFNIRRIFIGLALSGMMVAISSTSFASGKKEAVKPTVNIQPAIEYIGENGAETLLHVSFETEAAVKFELVVTDAGGDVLYSNEFETAKFSKYLKLVNEGNGDATAVSVSIRTLPNGTVHSFGVSSEEKTVKSVSVTKI
jgi:hypothetical protein